MPDSAHLAILRADPGAPKSKILCSSLRRAVSTIAGGFKDRFARRPVDKILILPALQEGACADLYCTFLLHILTLVVLALSCLALPP